MQSVTTQAFVNGDQAAGASQLKPGFAISPEDDLMFALGYPRLKFILDDHPDDEPTDDYQTWVQRCFRTSHASHGAGATPRGIAYRQLRNAGRLSDAETRDALLNPDPLSLAEAEQCIRNYLEHKPVTRVGPAYLFEALFGPDALLAVLVPLLKAADPTSVDDKYLNYYADSLGPLLRRATQGAADLARAQLTPIYDASSDDLRSADSFVASLGVALGGATHARKYARRYSGCVAEYALEWCEDDPGFIHEQVMASPIEQPFVSYPRLVFLAGDDLTPRYQTIVAKERDVYTHGAAIEQFGRIKSLNATRMMLWLATKSKTKTEALAWLKQHESVFEPFLAAIHGTNADDAKLVNGVRKKLKKL